MKYLKQFCFIILFSLIGEFLNYIIPLPIPASIYGIILLFISLLTGIIKLENVEGAGEFLIEIMPIMFIPAAVGLLESWQIIKSSFVPFIIITVISTVAVMYISGIITQIVIKHSKNKKESNKNAWFS